MRYIVALTGGIGSGKSTVANAFADLGINVIDADIIARQVVEPGAPALHAIADHFAYEFRTLIYISKRGVYRFYTISDDGSKLYIDDKLIVDNDGGHSVRRAEGKVALEKGYHALHLLYFENYMGQELEVGFLGRDIPETPIPAEMLFLPD